MLFTTSLLALIFSSIYIGQNDPDMDFFIDKFENQIMFFKFFDLQILSFFDFIGDDDCLNTGVFITIEKLIWMIIETLFDIFEIEIKTLFIIQIVASGIFAVLLIFIFVFLVMDILKICERKKREEREQKEREQKEKEQQEKNQN